jgi:hypothetical protein
MVALFVLGCGLLVAVAWLFRQDRGDAKMTAGEPEQTPSAVVPAQPPPAPAHVPADFHVPTAAPIFAPHSSDGVAPALSPPPPMEAKTTASGPGEPIQRLLSEPMKPFPDLADRIRKMQETVLKAMPRPEP